MKKVLLFGVLSLGLGFGARAQWVSIPDSNFGKWLNTNGYSTCLQGSSQAGWQMDTSCPAVVNAIKVDCGFKSMYDLTGIQYFDNLDTLYCTGNDLTFLPSLPGSLAVL